MRKPRRILLGLTVSLLVLAVADQVALRTLLRHDRLFNRAVAPFDPPVFSKSQAETLARIRASLETGKPPAESFRFDPELGWCNPKDGGHGDFTYDGAGCRIGAAPLPREKTPGVRRIVTLGCSMTHGEEVGPRDAWCSLLDELRDDVEVANLGVAAYGLDQALLRYRRDGVPLEGDEVWLGLLPEAALRVTSVYWPALHHWSLDVSFKPRFTLGKDDALVLVPCPVQSLADVVQLLDSQERFLEVMTPIEPAVARAPLAYAPRGSSVLHHTFAGRILLSLHEAGGRDLVEHLRGPEQETYRLLRAIILATAEEARAHGSRFRLLILPGLDNLAQRKAAGRGFWVPLTDDLAARGIEVIDVSPALEGSPLPRTDLFAPMGHYTRAGSLLVAEALAAHLDR